VILLTGGEAMLAAEADEGVSSPAWAPDSKRVLFLSRVWTEKKPESDVRVVKHIKYKLNARAVTFRSICNWVSKFGVSDFGYFQPESISGRKTYWGDEIEEQLRHSPIKYVHQVKTSCLIIQRE
jgi:dipeptidyl aminopeptidase/acylaminoacyl peptidase